MFFSIGVFFVVLAWAGIFGMIGLLGTASWIILISPLMVVCGIIGGLYCAYQCEKKDGNIGIYSNNGGIEEDSPWKGIFTF